MGETVTEIVREMRDGFNKSWRDIDREWAHGLADRIEAAYKREAVTDCNQMNGAKIREAFEQVFYIVRVFDDIDEVRRRVKMVESSLDAPPRNCDKCKNANQAVALAIEAEVLDDDFDAWDMAEFLLAEAKGDAK